MRQEQEVLRYIHQLKDLNFNINKYQRGYRWGMREIHSLLEDISGFDESQDSFYCLQPLVIKPMTGPGHFELIDGQQRCTTIYLILKFLNQSDFFQLHYQTRGNGDGQNNFLQHLQDFEFPDLQHSKDAQLDGDISHHWKNEFIQTYPVSNTVDNFYFFKAYCLIKRWFLLNHDHIERFNQNLLYRTKVIWYESEQSQGRVSNTFINFNDGKISLDQAELIKGLFVLDFKQIPDATRRAYEENQFAEEWNSIEQHLKVPAFWNFTNNDRNRKELANKITLILQLHKGKGDKEEDLFYTYRAYEKAFKTIDKPNWHTLSGLYNQLEEWYVNRETYHLMGAVVHLTDTTIHQITGEYKDAKQKDALKDFLKNTLRKEFYKSGTLQFKEGYDPDTLKYGKSKVFNLLLLYNIAVAQLTDKYYKFPFDLFRAVESWNIEHIYAKKSKGFETLEDLQEWHAEILEVAKDNPGLNKNEKLASLLAQVKPDDLSHSNQLIKDIENELIDVLDKDSLANLCFLDNVTNIQVGNEVFRKKRDMILEINHQLDPRAYLPIASKIVFQKALTPSEDLRTNYWNTQDRDAYLEDIKNKISSFLA